MTNCCTAFLLVNPVIELIGMAILFHADALSIDIVFTCSTVVPSILTTFNMIEFKSSDHRSMCMVTVLETSIEVKLIPVYPLAAVNSYSLEVSFVAFVCSVPVTFCPQLVVHSETDIVEV